MQIHRKVNSMTRREIREQIFLKLFQIEFHPGEDLDEQLRYQDTAGEMEETKDTEYIQKVSHFFSAKGQAIYLHCILNWR